MALRCQCGLTISVFPYSLNDKDSVRMLLDDEKQFQRDKIQHPKNCKQFKKWEVFFYNV